VDDQETSATDTAQILSGAHAYIQTLPPLEREIARMAAAGAPFWEIAQQTRISEGAVAHTVDAVVAAVTGRTMHPVETGGLGADTDPGVTGGYGGYGDAGFGSLDTGPMPDNREPEEDPTST